MLRIGSNFDVDLLSSHAFPVNCTGDVTSRNINFASATVTQGVVVAVLSLPAGSKTV